MKGQSNKKINGHLLIHNYYKHFGTNVTILSWIFLIYKMKSRSYARVASSTRYLPTKSYNLLIQAQIYNTTPFSKFAVYGKITNLNQLSDSQENEGPIFFDYGQWQDYDDALQCTRYNFWPSLQPVGRILWDRYFRQGLSDLEVKRATSAGLHDVVRGRNAKPLSSLSTGISFRVDAT
jgi:hypothetical protein